MQSPISEKADLEGGGAVQTELSLKRAHKTREVVDRVGHPDLGGACFLAPAGKITGSCLLQATPIQAISPAVDMD